MTLKPVSFFTKHGYQIYNLRYLDNISHKSWCPKCSFHHNSSDVPGFICKMINSRGISDIYKMNQPDSPLAQLHCCVVALGLSCLQQCVDPLLP